MKTRRLMCAMTAGVAALALLAGCAGGSGPRPTSSIRLILGHGAAPGNPRSDAALKFEELVEKKSNNTIDVQILGQETVGSDSEMMVSVAAGTLDMTINSQGSFAAYVPETSLIGLPFLFENTQIAYATVDDPEVENYLADAAEKSGFHVLGFWDNGMRDLSNSKREINSPEDLKGLKIRTPDDVMTIAIFKQLQANPTPLAFGELYLALKTGAVDGQENPVVNIKSSKLNEVQPHLAVTGHKYETNPFLVSTSRWARLTPEQRTIIEEAADEAREYQRELMTTQTSEIYEEFEKSLTVTHPDKEAFRAATEPVYAQWEAQYPEFYALIMKKAEESRLQYMKGSDQ
ncbi:TRAP transporter substrate-binding protein [Schaalia sp. ZJ405]|uniref:TRAP transporter substrate-binding protein n=1 Tax=unclassified Schaalia TaxID=2691889 RepID=UPI0013EDDD76|nr:MULTISPECIES: TRAP transporter substrate-binding protein [unclassified Schaalia]QPK82082.1 TRAP transporter substrate-binding protein [Schaalia sp. ZJ405]